jgi:hypothetical protein
MANKNDITGDDLKSKANTDLYREGWDRIFGKKTKQSQTLGDYIEEIKQREIEEQKNKNK